MPRAMPSSSRGVFYWCLIMSEQGPEPTTLHRGIYETLGQFISAVPFRPFTVSTSDCQVYLVERPEHAAIPVDYRGDFMVIYRRGAMNMLLIDSITGIHFDDR